MGVFEGKWEIGVFVCFSVMVGIVEGGKLVMDSLIRSFVLVLIVFS